jgi:hypothetical protein
LIGNPAIDRGFFNLKPLLKDAGQLTTYHLYYSSDNFKDALHAEHLADLENVRLHKRRFGGHGLARILRDSGELMEILLQLISNSASSLEKLE